MSRPSPAPMPPDVTTQTQYVREAPEIEARKLGLMDTARQLAETGLSIPTQQVAGFTGNQQDAFDMQRQGLGTYQNYLDNAANMAYQGSVSQYDPQSYQQFLNPYQQYVTQGIEDQFAKAMNQSNLQAAKAGAFGGARQGVEQANLAGAQAQAVGASLAQGYGQAQQMAMSDFANQQQRLQQGARLAAGLGQQQQQQQAADVTGLLQTGTLQQQREQMEKDAQFKQQMAQIYEPYQRVGFVSDIFQGSPTSASSLTMSTAPGTNPLAQAVGAGITGLAAYQGFANQGK
mgnify:FL=1|tara:strand:- start:1856 stop:2719 length:864 start_codon:yes stop_codon:yes gene_type:complete